MKPNHLLRRIALIFSMSELFGLCRQRRYSIRSAAMVGDFFIGIVSLRRLFQQVVHRVDAPLAVQEFCCDDGPQRQRAAVEYLVPQRQHVVRRGIGCLSLIHI